MSFDSYLWQTVQKKQEFIAQIMSSKSPVRSCDDVDETALSYAEIKALCAGNPLIAEKMALDNDVAKLRMLCGEHRSQHYRLEDDLTKRYPEQITAVTTRIAGIGQDIKKYAAAKEKCVEIKMTDGAASVESKFPGMTVNGVVYMEKEPAAKALLAACKGVKEKKTDVPVGEYMGFKMSLQYESFGQQINLHLRGAMTYSLELGTDALGNITRINNSLDKLPERLQTAQASLADLNNQVAAAKVELTKPFPQEIELQEKESRLALLNADLNIDGDGNMDIINDAELRVEGEAEQAQDEQDEQDDDERGEYGDDDFDEPEEPHRGAQYADTRTPVAYDGYAEQRTGTYGKAKPSILDDLDTTVKTVKPPVQSGSKSAEIDI